MHVLVPASFPVPFKMCKLKKTDLLAPFSKLRLQRTKIMKRRHGTDLAGAGDLVAEGDVALLCVWRGRRRPVVPRGRGSRRDLNTDEIQQAGEYLEVRVVLKR